MDDYIIIINILDSFGGLEQMVCTFLTYHSFK